MNEIIADPVVMFMPVLIASLLMGETWLERIFGLVAIAVLASFWFVNWVKRQ